MTLNKIALHDVAWRKAAVAKGYDSIVLMSKKGFVTLRVSGKIPRSIELNILDVLGDSFHGT